jgi:hypothetical protein
MSVTERAPERYTLWVCQDCKQPAHGPGDRCPRDRRRTWTQMAGVEYVRADLHERAVDDAAERIFASGILDDIAASNGGDGRDAMQDAVTIARLAFGGHDDEGGQR